MRRAESSTFAAVAMTFASINAVWIDPRLGPVHAACLRSFVRHGHRPKLHVYERPCDVPERVELADANELLPASKIIRYAKGGSPAIFSNLLRYEILRKGLGLYVDCDCYCLQPIEDADRIYGFESETLIVNAVLKLPRECPVLAELARIKDGSAFIPNWMSSRTKRYYRFRAALGKPVKIHDMPWGTTGPHALTWHLKQQRLDRYAVPIDVFYPVHYNQVPLLVDPELTIEELTTKRTRLLHLSNEMIKNIDLSQVPKISPLGKIVYET